MTDNIDQNEVQKFAIIKLDRVRGNICCSRREVIDAGKKQDKAEIIKKYPNEKIINICADIEDQITGLDKSEKESFMKDIGLNKTGINNYINNNSR